MDSTIVAMFKLKFNDAVLHIAKIVFPTYLSKILVTWQSLPFRLSRRRIILDIDVLFLSLLLFLTISMICLLQWFLSGILALNSVVLTWIIIPSRSRLSGGLVYVVISSMFDPLILLFLRTSLFLLCLGAVFLFSFKILLLLVLFCY